MIWPSIFAALAIAQTATDADTAQPEPVPYEVPDIRKAPTLPPWPEGLGVPLMVPSEAECVHGHDALIEGYYMTNAQGRAVTHRLLMLDAYPLRCQARLDALGDLCRTEVVAAVDVALAEVGLELASAKVAGVPERRGWEWWQTALAITGAVVVGAVAGAAAWEAIR